MHQLFSRLFVSRFYKINAGFFLTLFIILFGILPGPDTIRLHKGIMEAAVSSGGVAVVFFAVCLLYHFKCIAFVTKEMQLPENSFLYNLQTLTNNKLSGLFLATHVAVYFPMFLYGLLTVYVGFSTHHYVWAAVHLSVQLTLCYSGVLLYRYQLNSTYQKPLIPIPSITLFRKKNPLFYLLHYSLNSKKGAFIAIKLFSLLLLQFLVVLNDGKASKENICFMLLFSISTHALLPVYYVRFTETELSFMRNLPIGLGKRMLTFVVTYAILFIPEILFLLWNEAHVMPLSLILCVYLLAIVRLTLYTSFQYLNRMTLDRYTGVVMGMFFVSLILLASLNLWVFIAIESVVAIGLFYKLFYAYEGVAQASE